jgi:hypothetical protein
MRRKSKVFKGGRWWFAEADLSPDPLSRYRQIFETWREAIDWALNPKVS